MRENRYNAEYWFTVNMVTSILSTLLFIILEIILQRLRRSNRLRSKMERFLPTSKHKESKPWFKKNKKKKEASNNFSTNLPYPQVDSYQQYCKMMEKNGFNGFYPTYPSAPYPSSNYPMPRNSQMTSNNERSVVPRQEDTATRDIVTIEQHQDLVNRELAHLENGRGSAQA